VSKQQLVPHIAGQVVALQQYGPRTTLPRSKQALSEALSLWRGERSQANQELWRFAALAHGAVVAFAGNWQQAVVAYHPNPNLSQPGSDRYPSPLTSTNLKLAAAMYINQAVAIIRYGGADVPRAHNLAGQGLVYLKRAQDPRLVRWHGVALAAQSYSSYTTGARAKSKGYAEQALPYTGAAQPDLRQLLMLLAGQSTGRLSPAGFEASQCLYYFNE
jgi:hypothetical protein